MRKYEYHQDIANLSVFILWTGEKWILPHWKKGGVLSVATGAHRLRELRGFAVSWRWMVNHFYPGMCLFSKGTQHFETKKKAHTLACGKRYWSPSDFCHDMDARHNLSCHKSQFLSKCSLADAQGFIVTYQTRQSSYFHLDWHSINYTTG